MFNVDHNLRSNKKKANPNADTMMNSDKTSALETEIEHSNIPLEAKIENSSAHSQIPTIF